MATAAQEEFDKLVASNTNDTHTHTHPEDREDADSHSELSEEEAVKNERIEAAMRMSVGPMALNLPPLGFDRGHATGVKGVIADARHYQTARRSQWARRSVLSTSNMTTTNGNGNTITAKSNGNKDGSGGESETEDDDLSGDEAAASGEEEELFLQKWREARRRELESEARTVATRRTSPSVRAYGRMDEVDALGYLDAIEKVGRETTVVVFVYDHECAVSAAIDAAIRPLVAKHRAVRFVKIHYEEIEFDNAAVPAVLAYRNQGDLVANLTGIIEMMPDDDFGSDGLERMLGSHGILDLAS